MLVLLLFFHAFTFPLPVLTMKKGQRMGWGIQYNPTYRHNPDFDDKQQQLVLCYVTIDVTIVYAKMMLQPAGGWYPVIMLHPYGEYTRELAEIWMVYGIVY